MAHMDASYIADALRDIVMDRPSGLSILPLPVKDLGSLRFHSFAGFAATHFDMVMTDGRVMRVRVSDITPEKETRGGDYCDADYFPKESA